MRVFQITSELLLDEVYPMKDIIMVKGNKFGLNIFLDDTVAFDTLKQALFKKFNESRKFFGNSKVSIEFVGRELTSSQIYELVEVIQEASDLDIVCVIDENMQFPTVPIPAQKEQITSKPIEVVPKEQTPINISKAFNEEGSAIFHKGTLRSGQEIVTDSSIIVLGNVHNGATIVSKGNVIVIGKLSGCVHAGKGGNEEAFVVALNMSPTQLRIADVFGRSPDKKGKKILAVPQVAFVEDERIVIENINRNFYDQISAMH